VGGHEAVRGEFLEDVVLTRRVKHAGGKILFLLGAERVETQVYRHFSAMWQKIGICYGTNRPFPPLLTVTRVWFLDLVPPLFFMHGLVLLAAGGGIEAAIITLASNYLAPGAAIFCALLLASLAAQRWLGLPGRAARIPRAPPQIDSQRSP
jgi:hypothetical protein